MKLKLISLLILITCITITCKEENNAIPAPSDAFTKKWYAGTAEISSYTLQQVRYGEMRNGEASLIFVTEDYSTDKLVKPDEPEQTKNKVKVLKMNMTKTFVTGIYPYSMMLSVFKPVSANGNEKTLKVNSSSQEWCGHTFSQLHLKGNNYKWHLNSYFEKEVNQEKSLNTAILEDELWTRIRINPQNLPQGKVTLIPGLLWQRLSHSNISEEVAEISLTKADTTFINEHNVQLYTINYPDTKRTLQIYFKAAFPHEILGWKETYADGFGNNKKVLTTTAILKKMIWLDYWKHNANVDSLYRDTLQLNKYGF